MVPPRVPKHSEYPGTTSMSCTKHSLFLLYSDIDIFHHLKHLWHVKLKYLKHVKFNYLQQWHKYLYVAGVWNWHAEQEWRWMKQV